MICNSPNGSTVGYEKIDNCIKAIRQKEEAEDGLEVFAFRFDFDLDSCWVDPSMWK